MIWKMITLIGFCTSAVAVSTAENATGDKFWMCIVAGLAGLVLMGLAICKISIDISTE